MRMKYGCTTISFIHEYWISHGSKGPELELVKLGKQSGRGSAVKLDTRS